MLSNNGMQKLWMRLIWVTPNYSVKHQIRQFKFLSRGSYCRHWLRLFPLEKGWQCKAFVKLFGWQSKTELQTQSRTGDVSLGQGRISRWHRLTAQLSGTAGNHRRVGIGSVIDVERITTWAWVWGKRSFFATFHPNLQPTQQMWSCAEGSLKDCARNLLCPCFLITLRISNKALRSPAPILL